MDDELHLNIGEASDPGLVRLENEDALGFHVPDDVALRRTHGALFVVCDGIGGFHGGRYASRLAVESFIRAYYASPERRPEVLLNQAAVFANETIYRNSQDRKSRMGTTVVAAVIRGSALWVLNVGDSRAYLWRRGLLRQLSRDHTPADRQRPEDRRINRALGTNPRVEPFQRGPISLEAGDSILLCTDGLTTTVAEAQIARTIGDFPAPQAARQLIEQAKTAGAHDNVSLLLVNVAASASSAGEEVRAYKDRGKNGNDLWTSIRQLRWKDVNPVRLITTQGWRSLNGAIILLVWLALVLIAGVLLGWQLGR